MIDDYSFPYKYLYSGCCFYGEFSRMINNKQHKVINCEECFSKYIASSLCLIFTFIMSNIFVHTPTIVFILFFTL